MNATDRTLHRSGARSLRQKLALPLLLVLGASVAFASAPQDAPKEAAKLTPSEILARAIAAQGLPPSSDAAADLPLALHAQVHLTFKSDKGDEVEVDAERKFLGQKDGPGYVWTRAVPSSSNEEETILAFDGKRPWLWSKAAAKRGNGLLWLDEPPVRERDVAQLEDDLRTTALLTRAFLLRNLPSQWHDLKRLADVTRDGLTAWVIEGIAEVERDGRKKPAILRLFVEQKSAWLYGARVMIEGEPPLQLCFTSHEKRDGVVVPGKIVIYVDDEPNPRQTLYVKELKLAPKLDPKDFAPPSSP